MGWFDDLKSTGGAEPAPGTHTAALQRAVIREGRNGPLIILEWQTVDFAHYWTSFHGVSGKAKPFTKQTLSALDIDLSQLASEDQLADELAAREGTTYVVKVTQSGDWLNTDVLERPDHVQPELPADTAGLPVPVPAAPKAASMFDDIPF